MAHRRLLPKKGYENISKWYFIVKPHVLNTGIGRNLPAAYKRYYEELCQEPSAVHHIPATEKYKRDPETGITSRVQDDPPAIVYPMAFHKGLWGGAGVIKGFHHPKINRQRQPRWWAPKLQTSVVYSEVLDMFMTAVVTKRTIQLIHKYYGFDHYLLQSPACDLRSNLALKIKRQILLALDKNELPHKDPQKREQVYESFKHYLEKYDSEYIQWYGLKINEAVQKMAYDLEQAAGPPQPLKNLYRKEFIEELRAQANAEEAGSQDKSQTSLLDRFNIFKSKK